MSYRILSAAVALCLASGSVAAQYFQQRVSYSIDVSLDDRTHMLDGTARIAYVNRSPDTLHEVYMHLWPNGYRDNETALVRQLVEDGRMDLYNAGAEVRGAIDGLDFRVDDIPVKAVFDSLNPDICRLPLNSPLASGDSLVITTPFRVKVPSARFSRMGREGQSYYITQWYPKPAVYDLDGWHPMPYLDQGEYYSEFGSFDVRITLPRNYVIGATGERTTGSDIRYMDELAARPADTKYASASGIPASDTVLKTVEFVADSVHDFGWFASKTFCVEKGVVELPSGRTVTTWVLHTGRTPERWSRVLGYERRTLLRYSRWLGEYPYPQCTVVEGTITAGGGMEYPMITIIHDPASDFELEDITAHEVGHNWLYGILGSNEREHPWMDEGINSFYELRYVESLVSEGLMGDFKDAYGLGDFEKLVWDEGVGFRGSWMLEYLLTARTRYDQACTLPSEQYTRLNYGTCVYAKTGLSFNFLMHYLGEARFDACMKAYYDEWKFRHPQPGDLRRVFARMTGDSLSWFFDGLLGSNAAADYAVVSARTSPHDERGLPETVVTLKNAGTLATPVPVAAIRNDSVVFVDWVDGFSGRTTVRMPPCDRVRIDPEGWLPELDRRNNTARTTGLLRTWDAPRLRPVGGTGTGRPTMYFLPAVGWNTYDKVMAGVILYNRFIPNKDFEYSLVPLVSTRSGRPAGTGSLTYTWYMKRGALHHIEAEAGVKHFAHDYREVLYGDGQPVYWSYTVQPSTLRFVFRKEGARSPRHARIEARQINTWQEESVYDGMHVSMQNVYRSYQSLAYVFRDERTFDPYGLRAGVEHGDRYVKAMAEGNYTFSYSDAHRGVSVRLVGGAFLFHDTDNPVFNLRLSSDPGYRDYRYDHLFFGRSETDGILSQQLMPGGGGFKLLTAVGSSDRWIAALNVTADFPGKLPFAFFADAGTFAGAWEDNSPFGKLAFEAGITVRLIRDVAEVYVPLLKSSDLKDALDANGKEFKDQIRFLFDLNALNPVRWRDKALKQ